MRSGGARGSAAGGAAHVPLDAVAGFAAQESAAEEARVLDLIALDLALERLAAFDPQAARVVQYRFFGGLSEEAAAEVLGVSARTVRRSWTVARAWLRREMEGMRGCGGGEPEPGA